MQNSKGSGFLKVCGILMIIGGALSIIVSGILGIMGYIGAIALAESGEYEDPEMIGVAVLIGAIIAIIGGVLELIAGIIGVKNCKRPEKATTCIVWGFIVLVINVIGIILTIAGGTTNVGSLIATIIFSLALPVLYLIGAFLNKKSA